MLQVVLSNAQGFAAVQALKSELQCPAAGHCASLVQIARVTEHTPDSVAQLALFEHTLPVIEHMPAPPQSVLVMHAEPSRLHAPAWTGHCASDTQAAPVRVHVPALPHCASVVHGTPVTEHPPPTTGHCASVVHAAPVKLQLPMVAQWVVISHFGHSPPTHVLQPGGLYDTVQLLGSGWKFAQTCVAEPAQNCGPTFAQVWLPPPWHVCELTLPQDCDWAEHDCGERLHCCAVPPPHVWGVPPPQDCGRAPWHVCGCGMPP
jgi:hypothetical protein